MGSLYDPNVVDFILEYVSFSFSPFGTICEIKRLNEFLKFLNYFLAKNMELFFPKIGLDLIGGRQFLQNNEISHRDLKPGNILVNNNHDSNIPVDTGRKLNVHKTFRRRPGRLLNVLCTFNLRPASTGIRGAAEVHKAIKENSISFKRTDYRVTDSPNKKYFSNTDQIFTAWYATIYATLKISY